jgi:hypothetical protein
MTEQPKRKAPVWTPEMRAKAAATRAAKKLLKTAKPAPSAEFSGLTEVNCCDACYSSGVCVISGKNVCAHPNKGGLQPRQMSDGQALARFARARDMLA